jgi:hypothetical protein
MHSFKSKIIILILTKFKKKPDAAGWISVVNLFITSEKKYFFLVYLFGPHIVIFKSFKFISGV